MAAATLLPNPGHDVAHATMTAPDASRPENGPRALGPRALGPRARGALRQPGAAERVASPFPTPAPTARLSLPRVAMPRPAEPPAPPLEGGGWLGDWCRTAALEDRLAGVYELSKKRLTSREAAEVWLHLMTKVSGLATAAETESLIRQFILLAPEHFKASAMYEALMATHAAAERDAPEIVFMITSCERYLEQAERVLGDLQARGATAFVMTGDPGLPVAEVDGTRVRLPVADTYEALSHKVLEGLTWVRRRYGAVSIVKVDDDMRFNRRLDPANLAALGRALQYVGHPIGVQPPDRCWHLGKTSTPQAVFSRRHHGPFAYGPMYVLGPRAVDHLVREWVFYPGEFAGQIYEDRAIGDTLRRAGIDLKPIAFGELGGIVDLSERYVEPRARQRVGLG